MCRGHRDRGANLCRSSNRVAQSRHGHAPSNVLLFDATDWHTYSAGWTSKRVCFLIDDRLVRVVHQHFDYPLQLMVDLFEFPDGLERDPAAYPKVAEIKTVRGYRTAA